MLEALAALAALLLLLLVASVAKGAWAERRRAHTPARWQLLPPHLVERVVLASSDVCDATRALQTCTRWRSALRQSRRVWKSCVRLRGPPPRQRGAFWLHLAGAGAAARPRDWAPFEELRAAGAASEWASSIRMDVARTYVKLQDQDGPDRPDGQPLCGNADEALQKALTDVLCAMAAAFPRVGYCQGCDYIAVHALRVLGTSQAEPAFWLLALVFDELRLHLLFEPGFSRLEAVCRTFETLLQRHVPRAAAALKRLDMDPEMYLVGWSQTLFVYVDSMPEETVSRVWDVLLLERSYKVVVRVALAIVAALEDELEAASLETAMRLLRRPPRRVLEAAPLMRRACQFKVTTRELEDMIRARQAATDNG